MIAPYRFPASLAQSTFSSLLAILVVVAGRVFAGDVTPSAATSPERIAAAQSVVVASVSAPPSNTKSISLPGATQGTPFVNALGMRFIHVPGTKVLFSVWDTRVQDYAAYARENKVDDTWTREKKANVPMSLEPELPVVGVSWEDARTFCKWLTEKEEAAGRLPRGTVYRLPTDEEWSRAVGLDSERGDTPQEKSGKDQIDFPWGRDFPPKQKVGNYADLAFHAVFSGKNTSVDANAWIRGYRDGFATTSPVGSFPANAFGLYDMGGNVWQWCEDRFGTSREDGTDRTLRGASWDYSDRKFLLSSHRIHSASTKRSFSHGFRCVLDVFHD
jgi:formylglycine-generating enzyme required for sulfatase activity